MPYRFQLPVEVVQLLFITAGREGLVLIEDVLLPLFHGSDIGHQHVGAGKDRFLTSLLCNGLQSRGGSDIDIGHQDAQQ